MRVVSLPLGSVIPDPDQPRTAMPRDALAALAESVRRRGLLLPLRVRPADAAGRHVVVSGHRRLAALQHLGAETVPCVVVADPLDAAAVLAEQIAENVHRADLDPIAEAEGFRRYLALRAVPAARAAEELHVPASRISKALALLALPDPVRAAVRAGTVPKETAYHLSRLPDGDERERLVARALAGALPRDRAARATRPAAAASAVKRVVCRLPGGRAVTAVGAAVHLDALIETLEDVLKAARTARGQGWDVATLARVLKDRAAPRPSP